MKTIIFLITGLLSSASIYAQSNWTWAVSETKTNSHVMQTFSVAIDNQNDIVSLAKGESANPADKVLIIYKHNPVGVRQWAVEFPYTDILRRAKIEVDANNNIIIGAEFRGDITIGTNTYSATNSKEDIVLLKLNNQGGLVWSVHDNQTTDDEDLWTLDVAPNGDIYYGARFSGSTTTAGTTTISGGPAAYIAKYDSGGNFQWAQSHASEIKGVAANNSHVYVYGAINSTTFADSTFPATATGAFLARYDAAGNFQNVHVDEKGSGDIVTKDLAIDPMGNLYATGFFLNSVTIAGQALTANNNIDTYLSRYDNTAQPLGVYQVQATGFSNGVNVAINGTGNYVLLGQHAGDIYFAGDTLFEEPTYSHDVFVLEFDSSHNPLKAWQILGEAATGTTEIEEADIAAGMSNDYYINGYFKGQAAFTGLNSLTSVTVDNDFFLAKIGQSSGTNVLKLFVNIDARVFPNPFKQQLCLELNESMNASFELLDMSGRRVKQQHVIQGNNQIEIQDLPKGIYVATLKNEEGKLIFREPLVH